MDKITRSKFLDLMRRVRGVDYTRGWLEGNFLFPLPLEQEEKLIVETTEVLKREEAAMLVETQDTDVGC